jgi:hypothetical protein
MNLSEEQLKEVEEMAELFFNVNEIAANIEADAEALDLEMEMKRGLFYRAYMKGWLKGDVALRRSIAKAAENGSSPAQQMMLNYQKNAK